MILNFTIEFYIDLLAAIFASSAAFLSFKKYFQIRQRLCLILALTWLTVAISPLLMAFSKLFLNHMLFRITLISFAGILFSWQILSDLLAHDKIDPIKLVINTILTTSLIWASLDPSNIVQETPNDIPTLNVVGSFLYTFVILIFVTSVYMIFISTKIFLEAPKDLKGVAFLFLFTALIGALGTVIGYATALRYIIPGIHFIFYAVGSCLQAIAFYIRPELGYVLPFRAIRLTIIHTKGGIPLYNYSWSEHEVGESLFSSMIQGISLVLKESLKGGDIQEIHMRKAVLLLEKSSKYPVVCVLASTKASKCLEDTLSAFSAKFFQKYSEAFSDPNDSSQFKGTDELIEEFFPFIPTYEATP